MDDSLGNEAPGRYAPHVYKRKGKYLVVIDAAGAMTARLFDENRHAVGEFDAGSEEVAVMTRGLQPARAAAGAEWDDALEGHSRAERLAADVYTLDL